MTYCYLQVRKDKLDSKGGKAGINVSHEQPQGGEIPFSPSFPSLSSHCQACVKTPCFRATPESRESLMKGDWESGRSLCKSVPNLSSACAVRHRAGAVGSPQDHWVA